MRMGIGLPAAVPRTDMTLIGEWAEEAERAGFESVGVIDRPIYDNLDPLTALAAAAVRTSRIELITTVLNVCRRANAVLLAKQLSSVDRLSGGRVRAGLGMAAWPADYEANGVPLVGRGALFDESLAAVKRAWRAAGSAPRILVGGTANASLAPAAMDMSDGWVAPLFDLALFNAGADGVRRAWGEAGREGRPRIATGRYFSLGPAAEETADEYIRHYYGPDFFDAARADTLTDAEQIHAELRRLAEAGCADVVLYPCSGDIEQVSLLAGAVHESGTTA